MAVWEKRTNWVISQVSWTDWTAQDVYYGLEHSFQYSANINTDDEMHGIKLANEPAYTSNYSKCQLVSLWNNGVLALPATTATAPKKFEYTGSSWTWGGTVWPAVKNSWAKTCWNYWSRSTKTSWKEF